MFINHVFNMLRILNLLNSYSNRKKKAVIQLGTHWSQDICKPISQIVLKNFIKIIIKECPEEIFIKLANVLKISKSSWNTKHVSFLYAIIHVICTFSFYMYYFLPKALGFCENLYYKAKQKILCFCYYPSDPNFLCQHEFLLPFFFYKHG